MHIRKVQSEGVKDKKVMLTNKKLFSMGLLFVASMISAQATTLEQLNFSSSTASGNITFAGATSGSLVTGIFAVGIDGAFSTTPTIPGTPAALQNVFLDYNATTSPDVITVVETGTSYAGIAANTTLLTIDLGSALSLNSGATGVNINFTGLTTNANTATFLQDIGVNGVTLADTVLHNVILNGTFNSSTHTLSASSNLLSLNVTTPEPGTYLMFISGIALMGFVNRKRIFSPKAK